MRKNTHSISSRLNSMLNQVDADKHSLKSTSTSDNEKTTSTDPTIEDQVHLSIESQHKEATPENEIIPDKEFPNIEQQAVIGSTPSIEPLVDSISEPPAPKATTVPSNPTKKKKPSTRLGKRKKKNSEEIDSSDLQKLEDSISVYERITNFSRIFTNSPFFTSVRVIKKKRNHLLLVFPELSFVQIIDKLITECLVKNKAEIDRGIDKYERYP